MIDREAAVKALEDAIAESKNRDGEYSYILNVDAEKTLKLLKEQEPVKVHHLHGTKVTMHEEIVFTDECGNCGGYLLKPWKACPICGRKVKWDD